MENTTHYADSSQPRSGPLAWLRNSRLCASWQVYSVVIRSRVASQASYRSQIRLDLFIMALAVASEIGQVLVLVQHAPTIGGLTLGGLFLLLGLANVSFSLASITCGHIQSLGAMVHTGTLETYYTRPLCIFGQLLTSEVHVQKLGRAATSLPILAYACSRAQIDLHWKTVLLLIVAIVSGTLIFACLFVIAGSIQFFMVNSAEVGYALTMASHFAAKNPLNILPTAMQWLYVVLLPVALGSYLPTLHLVGAGDSFWVPSTAAWWSPLVALAFVGASAICWRAGVSKYQGGAG